MSDALSQFEFRLYVSGMTPRSTAAINNITLICEKYLQGKYSLDVVDIYKRPELAAVDQIVASPTLVKKKPFPKRCFIGTLSNESQIMKYLDLQVGADGSF